MPANKQTIDIQALAPDCTLKKTAELTPFQFKVLRFCCKIPKGKVATYGDLAKTLGCRSAQAIGQALRRNPFAPHVPCHRVVNQALQLNGFEGRKDNAALNKKAKLLKAEGVKFLGNGRIDPACYID